MDHSQTPVLPKSSLNSEIQFLEKLKVSNASHAEVFADVRNFAILALLLRTRDFARYHCEVSNLLNGVRD